MTPVHRRPAAERRLRDPGLPERRDREPGIEPSGRPLYQRPDVARRYARGRALPHDVLAAWADAVRPFLPAKPDMVVLDLGAGTGVFARAWPRWCPCRVIAIEPAEAMRAEMIREGLPDTVEVIAARGERLPLRDASVGVAWLSTVIHHLDDLDRCVAELRRVLAADGVVLVRGLFADLGHPAGLELLPGWQQARGAFPSTATVETAFGRVGFRVRCALEVDDAGPATVGEAADRIGRLRGADSLLGQFTDEQIADGLTAMGRRDATERLEPSTLGLVVFGPAHEGGPHGAEVCVVVPL